MTDAERFWARLEKPNGEDGCWFIKSKRGYCILDHAINCRFEGKTIYVTRLAYQLTYGPIPAGQLLRHRCAQGGCCNPDHGIPGTSKENGLDVVARRLFGVQIGELCTYEDMF